MVYIAADPGGRICRERSATGLLSPVLLWFLARPVAAPGTVTPAWVSQRSTVLVAQSGTPRHSAPAHSTASGCSGSCRHRVTPCGHHAARPAGGDTQHAAGSASPPHRP